jgi:SAM-dependent methyltransferase
MVEHLLRGPNAEQVKYWNEQGEKWVALQEVVDGQIGPLGERLMDEVAIASGECVLDVGCGCGATTLELARRVAPTGAVVGIDISMPMLARAEERARAADVTNVRFTLGDAQMHAFDAGAFDVVFSRFGIMFFTHPDAAFANLRGALRCGGRLGFICWRSLQENPWLLVPLMAVAQHVPLPDPPAPGAPGPFALADGTRVRDLLTRAGFHAIAIEPFSDTIGVGGGDLDRAVEIMLQLGPAGAALRQASTEPHRALVASVRAALAPYHTPEAGVRLPAAAWLVTAQA